MNTFNEELYNEDFQEGQSEADRLEELYEAEQNAIFEEWARTVKVFMKEDGTICSINSSENE